MSSVGGRLEMRIATGVAGEDLRTERRQLLRRRYGQRLLLEGKPVDVAVDDVGNARPRSWPRSRQRTGSRGARCGRPASPGQDASSTPSARSPMGGDPAPRGPTPRAGASPPSTARRGRADRSPRRRDPRVRRGDPPCCERGGTATSVLRRLPGPAAASSRPRGRPGRRAPTRPRGSALDSTGPADPVVVAGCSPPPAPLDFGA